MAQTRKHITGGHWLWLVFFVIFGSGSIVIVPMVIALHAAGQPQGGETFSLIFMVSWVIGVVPTLITGIIIVLSGWRRSWQSSLYSGFTALCFYGLFMSKILHGSSFLGRIDGKTVGILVASGILGTLAFSIFLPAKDDIEEKEGEEY